MKKTLETWGIFKGNYTETEERERDCNHLEGRVTVVTTVVQPQFRISPISEMLKGCPKANSLGKKREGLL